MMIRKSVFEEVGGFNEGVSDDRGIDFCLKVRSAGYRIVWTPWAEFYHDGGLATDRKSDGVNSGPTGR
jgi:GT2 family glycosyltransferase